MRALLDQIDALGYYDGTAQFFKRYPELQKYIGEFRRSDWVYHCLPQIDNDRCLDIGSGLGNISEMLSHLFQEVYSLEAVSERIEFQKRRFKNSSRSNIVLTRGNAFQLPFQNNFFDLVVCNGVLEWMGMMNTNYPPRKAQLLFLHEVKRVLSSTGCLYIGIENRIGLPFLLGARDHSGLPYTSLMPRRLASSVVKKFGQSGGLYGSSHIKRKEERGYFTYTYTLNGYRSLLGEAGFKFKSFWVFPSYNIPYFSGLTEDKIGLKGFTQFFKNNLAQRYKYLLSILGSLNKSLISLLAVMFTPSFLFYCYKGEPPESIDDIIINNTGLSHYTTISLGSGIMYILFDEKGKPQKVARLKRRGPPFSDPLPHLDKSRPAQSYLRKTERAWIEEWISGRKLDPLKINDALLAIEWLINFQKKDSSISWEKNYLLDDIKNIRTQLSESPNLASALNYNIIDDYEGYIVNNNLTSTPEHGDFFYGNILVDSNEKELRVIDWEHFKDKGDPLYDFIWFIINSMRLPDNSLAQFQANIENHGKFNSTLDQLLPKIDRHFGFQVEVKRLIPYTLLRTLVRKQLERGTNDEVVLGVKQMLEYYIRKN